MSNPYLKSIRKHSFQGHQGHEHDIYIGSEMMDVDIDEEGSASFYQKYKKPITVAGIGIPLAILALFGIKKFKEYKSSNPSLLENESLMAQIQGGSNELTMESFIEQVDEKPKAMIQEEIVDLGSSNFFASKKKGDTNLGKEHASSISSSSFNF